MHWVRKPRLNSAVATVAVLMVLSLVRMASLSLVMVLRSYIVPRRMHLLSSFRDTPLWRGPGIHTPRGGYGFRARAFARPGMTTLINRRLADRRTKAGFEEVKVAAFIGLLDVAGEHPAIAALESGFGLLPFGAAFCQLRLRHIEIDAARSDVERNAVAVLHQRQRAADVGFRRDMQDAGAVAGAAHPRIRQPNHIPHALLYEFCGNRQHAPLRHARSALRTGVAQNQDMIG